MVGPGFILGCSLLPSGFVNLQARFLGTGRPHTQVIGPLIRTPTASPLPLVEYSSVTLQG